MLFAVMKVPSTAAVLAKYCGGIVEEVDMFCVVLGCEVGIDEGRDRLMEGLTQFIILKEEDFYMEFCSFLVVCRCRAPLSRPGRDAVVIIIAVVSSFEVYRMTTLGLVL